MAEVEIKDNTKKVIDKKEQAVEAALEIVGGLLERYAKEDCPVDTGLLRNSITYCLDGKSPHFGKYEAGERRGEYKGQMPEEEGSRAVYVGTNVEYATIVEMSDKQRHTVGKAHFIRDSLAGHIGEYSKIIEKELKKAE